MKKTKVLTVESYDDSATRKMLNRIYNTDEFKDFEIQHCFIEEAYSKEDLYNIISESILKNDPAFLLIHTGKEFRRLKREFSSVLEKLRSKYSELRIGIQNRNKCNTHILKILSNDGTTISLEKTIFRINR